MPIMPTLGVSTNLYWNLPKTWTLIAMVSSLTTVVTAEFRTTQPYYDGTFKETNAFIDAESLTMYRIGKPVYLLLQMYFTVVNICWWNSNMYFIPGNAIDKCYFPILVPIGVAGNIFSFVVGILSYSSSASLIDLANVMTHERKLL